MLNIDCKLRSILLLIVISNAVIINRTTEARPSEASNDDDSSEDDAKNIVRITEIENNTLSGIEKWHISDESMQFRLNYSKLMQSFMDQTVDPCDDFYKYACGNWNKTIIERQTIHKRNYLNDIIYTLLDGVDHLLLQEPTADFEFPDELHVAAKFYNSCLSATLLPMQKSDDYLNVIRSIGGFPAVDKATWNGDQFDWFNMTAHLATYGIHSIINDEIIPQYPFPPYFKTPEFGYDIFVHSDNIANRSSRAYKLNEKRMRTYLTLYGVSDTDATQVIEDIFEFWHETVALLDEFDENWQSCKELDSENFTRWNNYMAIVWNNIDIHLDDENGPCQYFYVEFDKICAKHKEAVANYLAMYFLYAMDAKLKDVKFQKEFCLFNTRNTLPYVLDYLYMTNYFNDGLRDELLTIINELRESLRTILKEAVWLDEPTRLEAHLKESTITPRVGKFENANLTHRLIEETKNIKFVPDNYAQNNMNFKKFKAYLTRYLGFHHKELPADTKPLELLLGMQVNAFYYNHDNSINIMAGILHPPAYHKHWPNSLKFGTIGYLIGHELTHGFDSVGGFFDGNGTERQWWSEKSQNVFDDRSTCFVNHYNSYKIPQINRNVNGNITLDENLADNGGIREALMAYRRYAKELYAETDNETLLKAEQMPGLNLSPDQLFFLGFAHLWCSAYKEEHFWEELTDEHTVDKYRVLGVIANYEEFAKAYNCPIGSKMNPAQDKCRLW